jgi:hypothetical protein
MALISLWPIIIIMVGFGPSKPVAKIQPLVRLRVKFAGPLRTHNEYYIFL